MRLTPTTPIILSELPWQKQVHWEWLRIDRSGRVSHAANIGELLINRRTDHHGPYAAACGSDFYDKLSEIEMIAVIYHFLSNSETISGDT